MPGEVSLNNDYQSPYTYKTYDNHVYAHDQNGNPTLLSGKDMSNLWNIKGDEHYKQYEGLQPYLYGQKLKGIGKQAYNVASNPLVQMGLGGLAGAYTAFHQAKQERDAIKQSNENIRKAITGLENEKTGVINRGTGAGTSLLNQYAISNDPRMQAGYSGMYSSNVGQTGQDVQRLGTDISKMRTMIQDVPTKDSLWANAFTGALGGIFGVGNLRNQYDQSKYYQNQYNQYYR